MTEVKNELTQELRDKILIETFRLAITNKILLRSIWQQHGHSLVKMDNPDYHIPMKAFEGNLKETFDTIMDDLEEHFPELIEILSNPPLRVEDAFLAQDPE